MPEDVDGTTEPATADEPATRDEPTSADGSSEPLRLGDVGGADEPAARVRELLEEISDAYELDAEVEIEEDDETIRGELVGEDLGLVIGRHGQTIDAIEHLALRLAYPPGERGERERARGSGERDGRKRIVVDAAGYRAKREEILQREADKAASDAVRFGRAVALDAMGPQERKIVHEYLRDRHDVETHSEGDEPDRHLVVSPALSAS
jgi:spoIIIJ-associated protein